MQPAQLPGRRPRRSGQHRSFLLLGPTAYCKTTYQNHMWDTAIHNRRCARHFHRQWRRFVAVRRLTPKNRAVSSAQPAFAPPTRRITNDPPNRNFTFIAPWLISARHPERGRDGMVDITDLKSVGLCAVGVQVPPPVPDPAAANCSDIAQIAAASRI